MVRGLMVGNRGMLSSGRLPSLVQWVSGLRALASDLVEGENKEPNGDKEGLGRGERAQEIERAACLKELNQ